jgi:hypothetical protein
VRLPPAFVFIAAATVVACAPSATTTTVAPAPQPVAAAIDSVSIRALVAQLDLEKYEATI